MPHIFKYNIDIFKYIYLTYSGPYTHDFFHQGGSKAYMPNKLYDQVPNTKRIINNVILKIVNIVFSGEGAVAPPAV